MTAPDLFPTKCDCGREPGQCVKGDSLECPLVLYGDGDDHDFEDDDEIDDFDCGLMRNGQCTQAGSEHCEFSCPNRESELFVGSAAWRRKHERKRK